MSNVEEILAERQKTHGDFKTHADFAQDLKRVIHRTGSWPKMTPAMQEGLEMIAHKIARIMNGNPYYKDHWDDIAGYATLVAKELACAQSTT